MNASNCLKAVAAILILTVGVLLHTSDPDNIVSAQTPGTASQSAQTRPGAAEEVPDEVPVDKYDRNATLWAHQRAGYESGWQRGVELYYMNCWMCHSEYVIAGDFMPVPSLRDVAKRLTDAQITMYIRNGAGRMPAFKQLTDADIKDLLALFKERCGTFPTGGGCFDEHNPPPNPLYRFGTGDLAPSSPGRARP